MRNDLVPLLRAAQFFRGVTQHLLQRAVRDKFLFINLEVADPDLGILENRPEELLAFLQLFLGPLAVGDALRFSVAHFYPFPRGRGSAHGVFPQQDAASRTTVT